MAEDRIQTYQQFWPYYVREHSHPVNRLLHFVGTTLAMLLLGYTIYRHQWWLLLAVMALGYGLAWIGHFGVEKNRPATFKYPLWSFVSDFKMWGLTLAGRMNGEVERAMAAARK